MPFNPQKPLYSNENPSATNLPDNDSIPPALHTPVPFTFSMLISNSLHPDIYSPVGSLIIPFYRPLIPYGYYVIVGIELLTGMLLKWSAVHNGRYRYIVSNNPALPDINALNQSFNNTLSNGEDSRILLFGSPQADRTLTQEIFQTPLIPTEGMTINIVLSAPVRAIQSVASTAYAFKLKSIDNAPGYLVPVILLILYFLLGPYFKAKAELGEE